MRMYIFICSFISLIICTKGAESADSDSLDCSRITPKSPETRLRRYLFCEYDSEMRPKVSKDNSTAVTVKLFPKFMEFDESGIFNLHTWMYFSWTDTHLTWDPYQFDNIQEIRVNSYRLWIPDFAVYNSAEGDLDTSSIISSWCVVTKNGKVSCVPAIKHSTLCEADYTLWPYDTQNCTIHFGSWAHTVDEINFKFDEPAIDMGDFVANSQWDIVSYNASNYACCVNDSFPTLISYFILRRHSRVHHAVYVTPAVVLMIITLITLWLDSRTIERISLAAVNIVCHILCICDLHWIIPANGANPPHLILFYRNSFILAAFTMILTSLSRKLHYVVAPPPPWISYVLLPILNYRSRQFQLNNGETKNVASDGDDDTTETMHQKSIEEINDTTWSCLAVIIEWLGFIFAFITYTALLLLLV